MLVWRGVYLEFQVWIFMARLNESALFFWLEVATCQSFQATCHIL